jgi:hypothetical protein
MAMIRQIQARYDAEQDRILLRVSRDDQKEFRIWLTRRFLSLILKALNQHLEIDPDISSQTSLSSKEEVKAFKREQVLEQADFQQPFADSGEHYPPEQAVPVAFKLNYSLLKDGLMRLQLLPRQGEGLDLVLTSQISISLIEMLTTAGVKGQWRLAAFTSPQVGQEKVQIN